MARLAPIRALALIALALITACGAAPAPGLSAQAVVDAANAAGLGLTNVQANQLAEGAPVPRSFQEHLAFTIPEVTPDGGQVFVCDTKQNCDPIYAYYKELELLAGPYLYQSPNGRVVVQLNSQLTPETAAKFEQVVEGFR